MSHSRGRLSSERPRPLSWAVPWSFCRSVSSHRRFSQFALESLLESCCARPHHANYRVVDLPSRFAATHPLLNYTMASANMHRLNYGNADAWLRVVCRYVSFVDIYTGKAVADFEAHLADRDNAEGLAYIYATICFFCGSFLAALLFAGGDFLMAKASAGSTPHCFVDAADELKGSGGQNKAPLAVEQVAGDIDIEDVCGIPPVKMVSDNTDLRH